MSKRTLLLLCFLLLLLLHQDSWWKSDPRLVLGVLPVSLAYHVFWTLLVALGWYGVTRWCWPEELDDTDTPVPPPAAPAAGATPPLADPPR